MKNSYKLNLLFAVLFLCVIVFAFTAFNVKENDAVLNNTLRNNIHKNSALQLVNSKKDHSENFENVDLFKLSSQNHDAVLQNTVSKATFLNVNNSALRSLMNAKHQNINLNIPLNNGNIELELVQVNFIPDDFKILTSDGRTENYNRGLYYQGIIKDNNNSMAAISIFDNEIIGIISTNEGNYNLGALQNDNNTYIFYNDRDLMKKSSFNCKVEDGYGKFYRNSNNNVTPKVTGDNMTTNPVKIYYVCDYQMYVDKGNTQNVVSYVTAMFNQANLLYNNEQLNLQMASSITVYTNPDPYRSYNTSQTEEILKAFGADIKNNILGGGHLAQLLSTRTPVTGAIAWVKVLCQSYEPGSQSGRYAFNELELTFNNVPVFSWSVEVLAHETGHNFGSSHTQACVWPSLPGGGIGAIDSCVNAEQGTCFSQTQPNPNGTIMSYCHIPQGGAINFTLGFGPLPGDTIRLRYSQALCIDNPLNSSEAPTAYSLLQNYPNPFNPATNIKFALPEAGNVTLRVFDVTGREVAELVNNNYYPIGIFSVSFDANSLNLASGVYIYKIDVTKENRSVFSEIKKMVLVK
ncbi:MAG: zinc-dependent metalloprotease [Ignavibacteria bacterium]|nr:zinc-dependent metalloprotease [Ignavibacteria bacterium]